jgi:hypothetical protein
VLREEIAETPVFRRQRDHKMSEEQTRDSSATGFAWLADVVAGGGLRNVYKAKTWRDPCAIFRLMKRNHRVLYHSAMGVAAPVARKNKRYSRAILDASDRLLKAVKDKIVREKGKVDYAALRRDGYSEELIARLKEL